jgi:hypothetical protein
VIFHENATPSALVSWAWSRLATLSSLLLSQTMARNCHEPDDLGDAARAIIVPVMNALQLAEQRAYEQRPARGKLCGRGLLTPQARSILAARSEPVDAASADLKYHGEEDMRLASCAVAAVILAGCASAPIVSIGDNTWQIGESGRDALRSDVTVWTQHAERARRFCAGRGDTHERIVTTPPDGKYNFRCVEPPAPPPPPRPAPPPPVASEQQLDVARLAWRECLEMAEPAIDDMISDGSTVATVLTTRCEPQFAILLDLTQMGQAYKAAETAFVAARRGVALDIVLQVRAKRRNPSKAPPPVLIPKLTPQGQ